MCYVLCEERKLRIYSIFVSISSCLIAFAISGIEFLAINRLEYCTSNKECRQKNFNDMP